MANDYDALLVMAPSVTPALGRDVLWCGLRQCECRGMHLQRCHARDHAGWRQCDCVAYGIVTQIILDNLKICRNIYIYLL